MIDTMCQQGIVKELTIESSLAFDHLCSSYAHRKSYQLPLSKQSSTKYDKIELVVIDLTSLISVTTWDGYVYTLVVVEVSCHYPVERLLKSKEKARVTVRDMVALLERQSGKKVQWFML